MGNNDNKIYIENIDMREVQNIIRKFEKIKEQCLNDLNINSKICFRIFPLDYQNNVLFSGILIPKPENNSSTICYHLLSNKNNNKSYFIISSYTNMDLTSFNFLINELNIIKNQIDKQIFITNLILANGSLGIYYNSI